jgi:hypothetical protein
VPGVRSKRGAIINWLELGFDDTFRYRLILQNPSSCLRGTKTCGRSFF